MYKLFNVPLVGVLFECREGILQSHKELLGGCILALYKVQSLLVAHIDVEANHRNENNRDIQLVASCRYLSICILSQISTNQ